MKKELPRSPDLAELLRIAIMDCIAQVHVSLPGRIETYDPTEQKADIKPMLKRPLVARDGTILEPESLPVMADVPIVFPRGGAGTGNFFITWPLAKGDLVHIVFNERSIDQYVGGQGEETDPIDFRSHNLSDGVAYPGFYPRALSLVEADADNAVFGRDEGMQLHVTPGDLAEFRIGGVADVSVAIAETLQTFWDSTVKPWLEAHTHGTGVGPSGPPLNVPAPTFDAAIISANVKLKDN